MLSLDVVLGVWILFIVVLACCSLVLCLNLLCPFVLGLCFCLNSWLCFWWVVLPSCCLHACIALVICSCVLRFRLFCPREPVNIWKRMCCGPSSKSGHRKYDKLLINLTDYIPFLWVRSQGYKHHFRPKPSDERGPTSSTPYNYTQPSARNFDDDTIRRQSFSTASYRTTVWSSLELCTGHAEA